MTRSSISSHAATASRRSWATPGKAPHQPADLRAMPAGRALALPQGREPIGVDLFAGAPGLSDCDWQVLYRHGRERLCQPAIG